MNKYSEYQKKTKEELIGLLSSFEEVISSKDRALAEQHKMINLLIESLKLAKHHRFGRRSEKHNPNQLSLFNEADFPSNSVEVEEADEEIHVTAHKRKASSGRKSLPEALPRKQRVYDLSDSERICSCGETLACIGEEKSEQLEIIPAKIYVVEHIEKKYACHHCQNGVKQAKKPVQPIPKSIAGPGLLSHVLVSKFQDHLPLYRQEQQLQRIGVEIARNTLSLWVIRCAELLMPLEKLLEDTILNYDIAYSDESRIQVLKEPDRKAESQSYLWLFSGGPPDKFSFVYRYDTSRSHEVPLAFFGDFKGYLHCDGFSAYDVLAAKNTNIILSGCMYHSRRKFVEANKVADKKSGIAYQALKIIQNLAHLEENIKSYSPEAIKTERQEKAKPLLDKLLQLLKEKQSKVLPKSLLGTAIQYTLNQWSKLLVYLDDGRLENNNNRTERGIKPFATGRKNWLFCDSVAGAVAAARIYSFIETCKFHQIEPYYWFAYVLKTIPHCNTLEELEVLLPFNIDRALLTSPDSAATFA